MREVLDLSFDELSAFNQVTGLKLSIARPDRIEAVIEAGPQHHTPWGIVHGGVYAAAVESACSVGASLAVQDQDQYAVGLSNHTDFLRPHRHGRLNLLAQPIHQGRTQQLWQCSITRGDGKLVARGQVRLQNVCLADPNPAEPNTLTNELERSAANPEGL